MKDKDKKAFTEYMAENLPYSYYQSYSCQDLVTWQVACEYKQKEIDELQAENENLRERIFMKSILVDSLKAENAKLRECVEFYADTNNWDAADGVHDSIISGVITGADHYEPWGNTGIAVGGKLARQTLKELKEID